ncbi:unnamed protein product [Protopolystoma xenopodis]|uniref:Uncharacterized protein n=1 Tax=Protopolystoma xenopodis TaxID=117903 RepID=A0A3S5AG16_9PLAT|nr:unnamed protein product [Protopolystoma xenopodis]
MDSGLGKVVNTYKYYVWLCLEPLVRNHFLNRPFIAYAIAMTDPSFELPVAASLSKLALKSCLCFPANFMLVDPSPVSVVLVWRAWVRFDFNLLLSFLHGLASTRSPVPLTTTHSLYGWANESLLDLVFVDIFVLNLEAELSIYQQRKKHLYCGVGGVSSAGAPRSSAAGVLGGDNDFETTAALTATFNFTGTSAAASGATMQECFIQVPISSARLIPQLTGSGKCLIT